MTKYTLSINNVVLRDDGTYVPADPANRDRAEYDAWLADGGMPDPYVAPIALRSVLPQDLMAQFTAADAAAIQAAVAGNIQFWLLWSAMQAQKDPMLVTNVRFRAGWTALVEVLGPSRMDAIAQALDVTIA